MVANAPNEKAEFRIAEMVIGRVVVLIRHLASTI
jgi:hypothetical protein